MEWPYVIEGERTDATATLAPEGGGGASLPAGCDENQVFPPPRAPGGFRPPGSIPCHGPYNAILGPSPPPPMEPCP